MSNNSLKKYEKYLRASLQLIPLGIGSAISTLWAEFQSETADRRLGELLSAFGERLSALENQGANIDYAYSDEFRAILEDLMRATATESVERKREQLRGVLIHSVAFKTSYDFSCIFVQFIKQFTSIHIKLLHYFDLTSEPLQHWVSNLTNPFGEPSKGDLELIRQLEARSRCRQIVEIIGNELHGPKREAELAKKAVNDLLRNQLIHDLLLEVLRNMSQNENPPWDEKDHFKIKEFIKRNTNFSLTIDDAATLYLITELGTSFLNHIRDQHPLTIPNAL